MLKYLLLQFLNCEVHCVASVFSKQQVSIICRKLIGSKFYNKGYIADIGHHLNSSLNNCRDVEGHGSHTLSTADGNVVHGASVYGLENATPKGGSPKARVASYKVCWPAVNDSGGCYDNDMLKAFPACFNVH